MTLRSSITRGYEITSRHTKRTIQNINHTQTKMEWLQNVAQATILDLLFLEDTLNIAMTVKTQKDKSISLLTKKTEKNIKKLSLYFSKQNKKQ